MHFLSLLILYHVRYHGEVKSKDDIRIFKVILGALIVGSVVIIVSSFAMMMSAKAERDSAQSSVNQVRA